MRYLALLVLWLCGACGFDLTGLDFSGCCTEGYGGGGWPSRWLAFGPEPRGATEGTVITPAVEVRFVSSAGDLIPDATDSVTLRISSNPSGGTLSGTTTVAAAHGVATFPNVRIDKRGAGYTLTAAATGFRVGVSPAFNVSCTTCWSSREPMPTPRGGLAVGPVNGVLYAVGGFNWGYNTTNGILTTLEAYEPLTNRWTPKTPMPTMRRNVAVGVVNGVLYAVGGDNLSSGALATVEAYDPVTDSWTTKAPMPTPRAGAVGVVDGLLYAVGGYNTSGGILATVEAYDPVANRWMTKAPMPTPRQGVGLGAVNGALYAVGGFNNDGSTATVEAYDPVANSWTTKAPMATPHSVSSIGVVNGVLYAVAGTGIVEAYDPVADRWTTKAPTPTSRESFSVGVVNDVLYAVGGFNSGRPMPTVEAYDPAQDR